jgi:hypothetical protein
MYAWVQVWEGERFLCLTESSLIISSPTIQPQPPFRRFNRWVQVGMNLANGPLDAADCAVNPAQFPFGAVAGTCWVDGRAGNTSCGAEPHTPLRICNGVHCGPQCVVATVPSLRVVMITNRTLD